MKNSRERFVGAAGNDTLFAEPRGERIMEMGDLAFLGSDLNSVLWIRSRFPVYGNWRSNAENRIPEIHCRYHSCTYHYRIWGNSSQ